MARPKSLSVGSPADYARLAELATLHAIPFETLAERFERGWRGQRLIAQPRPQPDGSWLLTEDAARILGVTRARLLELTAISRRLRNAQANSPRGNGYLWNADEVNKIATIARECRLTISEAVRVFRALAEERI